MARGEVPATIYQLRIELQHIRPRIWRRVLVPGEMTLAGLHGVILVLFDWHEQNLYHFEIEGTVYGVPDPTGFVQLQDAGRVQLCQVAAREGFRFGYTYDLDDEWQHRIKVEKILEPDSDTFYPTCIRGRRCAPPQDVGGPWGYVDFLQTLADDTDPGREELLEWVGGDWDADDFDLLLINETMQERFATARARLARRQTIFETIPADF